MDGQVEPAGALTPALRVQGLTVRFDTDDGPVHAVRSVDLEVGRGELVALLGESGSGKSVTARAVLGLAGAGAEVSADVLSVAGTDVLALAPRQLRAIRGERVSLVMQDALSALNPVLTVGEQIAEVLRVHRGLGRAAATARATELLGLVGIPPENWWG
jgi:oligopeptide transport system ATP-binding protein